jgi:predicted HicB family RNase H-like nuclease
MFDVKKPEMVNKTFRLPLAQEKNLQEVAQEKDVSLNSLVAQCCEYAIENLRKSENVA